MSRKEELHKRDRQEAIKHGTMWGSMWLIGGLVALFTPHPWLALIFVFFALLYGPGELILGPMFARKARRDADESFYHITGIRPDDEDE